MFICQPEGIDSCWTLWRSLSVAAEGVEPRTNHRAYDLPRLHLFVGGTDLGMDGLLIGYLFVGSDEKREKTTSQRMDGGKLCRGILANPPRTSNSC